MCKYPSVHVSQCHGYVLVGGNQGGKSALSVSDQFVLIDWLKMCPNAAKSLWKGFIVNLFTYCCFRRCGGNILNFHKAKRALFDAKDPTLLIK